MTTDTARDLRFMDQAIALARTGLGQTWPRPSVGCVLVKGDEVVGAGRTDGTRPAHAEAVALAAAGARAHGATAYVTLEPCAHHGATPPCADALVAAGIARAVVAIRDPDPRTNGAGLAILRQAGIEVATGCRAEAAAEAQAGFLTRVTLGRPRLILKLAMTLDGRIATATGESRWITGPAARAEVHTARAASDAVMIGAGTARVDDPSLTVRDAPAPPRPPLRLIADPRLSLPLTGTLLRTAKEIPVWILHAETGIDIARARAIEATGARLLPVRRIGEHLDAAAAFQTLGQEGLTSVYCEGGGRWAAALIQAGLVDEIHAFTAGKILGGDGIPGIGALGLTALADAPHYELREARPAGPDLFSRWIRAGVRP